jgi:hypothetical protein
MSKKKSLGHNPLAYSTQRHASFDFITPSENNEGDGDDKNTAHNKNKVNKITVSYYLEEPLVNKVKSLADSKESSYSALVTRLLKKSLKDISTD